MLRKYFFEIIKFFRYPIEIIFKIFGFLFLRSLNTIWSYIFAPEIFVLILVLLILFNITMIDYVLAKGISFFSIDFVRTFYNGVKNEYALVAQHLFSLDPDNTRLIPRLVFFLAWLVGGGALISSILSTSKRFVRGEWRKWPWLIRNHTVVLGWDGNVPTRILEHLESRKFLGFLYFPETFYILSAADSEEIRRSLKHIFRWYHLNINLYVYKGIFDDVDELNALRLPKANEIIIVGETFDEDHDSRVLLVPFIIQSTIKHVWYKKYFDLDRISLSWWRSDTLVCHTIIKDYGLFLQLLSRLDNSNIITLNKTRPRRMEIRCENFHDSWAKKLVFEDKVLDVNFDADSTSKILILGFGALGKAITAELLNRSDNNNRTSIKVALASRNRLDYEWTRFESQFNELIKLKEEYVKFYTNKTLKLDSSGVITMIREEIANSVKKPLTIIIVLKRSEKGMTLALSIM